ncbi:glycosyltransferase [Aquabacterium sp.]|uniref:glycosyltransferase n=1 Tax=Aquabacterium sp. TaxID=1872578 RepID=UPI0035B004F7
MTAADRRPAPASFDHGALRIVTVTTFFPNSADPHRTVFVANLVRAMRERCTVTVVAPVPLAPPFGRWRLQAGIPRVESVAGIEVLHPRFVVVPKLGWLSGLTFALGVVTHLARLKRELGVFVVHGHCAYPDGVGVALVARLLGLPFVVTTHGSDINVYAERPMLRWQIRWALRRADGVVAVSRALLGKVQRLLAPATPRVVLAPCAGFDPALFVPRPRAPARGELGLAPDARVVLFVGHLIAIKGVDVLIDAWVRLLAKPGVGQDCLLVLIGHGDNRKALESRATRVGLSERVRFVGAVAQAEVSRWMAAADLLCLPSRNEGTPNVVVEALASGLPVVASRVGGIPELVVDGKNGLLVPPEDPSALAEALANALSREWVRDKVCASVAHLTWTAIAAKNIELMQQVMNEACHAPVV